jgi:hypothetical protein
VLKIEPGFCHASIDNPFCRKLFVGCVKRTKNNRPENDTLSRKRLPVRIYIGASTHPA